MPACRHTDSDTARSSRCVVSAGVWLKADILAVTGCALGVALRPLTRASGMAPRSGAEWRSRPASCLLAPGRHRRACHGERQCPLGHGEGSLAATCQASGQHNCADTREECNLLTKIPALPTRMRTADRQAWPSVNGPKPVQEDIEATDACRRELGVAWGRPPQRTAARATRPHPRTPGITPYSSPGELPARRAAAAGQASVSRRTVC